VANTKAVLKVTDIGCNQETKKQDLSFYHHFPDFGVAHNPPLYKIRSQLPDDEDDGGLNSDNKSSDLRPTGGTDIFYRKSFVHNFTLQEEVIEKAYIQALTCTPKDTVDLAYPVFTKSFTILNVYLPSSDKERAEKLRMLAKLADWKCKGEVLFCTGDFNIKDLSADCSSGKPSDPMVRQALDRFLFQHGLVEIFQPLPTRIGKTSFSRIDRFFMSNLEIIKQHMTPTITFPKHPYEPGKGFKAPSDHFPLLLRFSPTSLQKGARFVIPKWLAESEELAKAVRSSWSAVHGLTADPFRQADVLDKVIICEARRLMRSNKSATSDNLAAIAIAMGVHRDLLKHDISDGEARLRCASSTILHNLVNGSGRDLRSILGRFLTERMSAQEGPRRGKFRTRISTFTQAVSSVLPKAPTARANYTCNIKSALEPKTNSLPYLVTTDGDYITEADMMATALKKVWQPIWADKRISDTNISIYLKSYPKKLTTLVSDISLVDVIREVSNPRDSCPGPNGIPFLVYSSMCSTVAPVFLRVIKELQKGRRPPNDFNATNLFFLPKDNTLDPRRMRPIAASDTRNRIIASILRFKLEDAVLDLLSKSQTGFVRGRSIEENVRYFNTKLCRAMALNTDCHIMFLDFAKAFDSVGRTYLLNVLHQISVPEHYCFLIEGLFWNVTAIPILWESSPVRIPMQDGLKQGCPLSPLFFLLAIDPLLHQLEKLKNIKARCFADDLAIHFTRWRDILPALQLVDNFSKASGVAVNYDKTRFITTQGNPPSLHDTLPSHWGDAKLAKRYVYLGVLCGTDITVDDVFERAWLKFSERTSTLMPTKHHHNLAASVDIANMYLLPIFGYLCRFYLMSEKMLKQVNQLLLKWCVNTNATNHLRLTAPTQDAGLHHPLKNTHLLNVAIMLRNTHERVVSISSHADPRFDLEMTTHTRWAITLFKRQTKEALRCEPQSLLYTRLSYSDVGPTRRLRTTLRTRARRHGDARPPSELSAILLGNTRNLDYKLAPYLRAHAFELIHRTLRTKHALKFITGSDLGCTLCGDAKVVEDIHHLFVACPLVKRVIRTYEDSGDKERMRVFKLLRDAKISDHVLEAPKIPRNDMTTLLCFSKAVWRARWPLTKQRMTEASICRAIISHFDKFRKASLGSPYTRRNRPAEAARFAEMLEALPPGHHAYTDGSAFMCSSPDQATKFPGPSGGGVVIYRHSQPPTHHSLELGTGTNQTAEAAALRHLSQILRTTPLEDELPLYIFIDNRTAIAVGLGRVVPRWCAADSKIITTNLSHISITNPVTLFWVPGHSKVEGNEIADRLARRGACGISNTDPISLEDTPYSVDKK